LVFPLYTYEVYRLVNNQEFIPTLSRSLHFSPSVTFTPCFIQQLESYIFLSLVSVYHISVKEFIFLFWSQYTIYFFLLESFIFISHRSQPTVYLSIVVESYFFSHVSLLFVVESYFSLKGIRSFYFYLLCVYICLLCVSSFSI